MVEIIRKPKTVVDLTFELELLREGDRSMELFTSILSKTEPRRIEIKKLQDRYEQQHLPIFDKPICDPMDIDNRIANDFFGEIINGKASYFAGNPMNFTFPEDADEAGDLFQRFSQRNRLDDVNYETTKTCGIGGYAARVLLTREDSDGKFYDVVRQLPPWECVFLGDDGIDEPEYAIHFVKRTNLKGETELRLDLYQANKIEIFVGESLEELTLRDTVPTIYRKCNLYGYENNNELQGDAEKVLSLIDDYDVVMSNRSSELEANRSAYLAFFGVDAPNDDDDMDAASVGTFYFKNNENVKQDAKFIVKDLPSEAIERHLDRGEDNIYRFSQTPNFNDKKTGLAASGLALEQRLLPLENKTSSFERKFVSGNIRMLECLADSFATNHKVEFDPYDVVQTFVRNTPDDYEYEVKVLKELLEVMPPEEAYSVITFSKNPKELAEWYNQKREEDNTLLFGGD